MPPISSYWPVCINALWNSSSPDERSGEEISMDWLAKYWWILVLVFLVGVLLNVIKDLKRIDHKKFLANKPELPPHRDFNDKWDDEEDWPKKDQPKK